MDWTDETRKALKQPFQIGVVKWKAQTTNRAEDRALAVAYINARDVMERLDRTVGPGAWSDMYRIVTSGEAEVVECTLTVLGVSKTDVGEIGTSSYTNKLKSGYSDAIKRAAIKFGIGRYLYSLPKIWVDYDKSEKKLVRDPDLPVWALPQEENTDTETETPPPSRDEDDLPADPEMPLKPREETPPEKADTATPRTEEVHWMDQKTRNGQPISVKFWMWCKADKALNTKDVHEALGVEHVHDYPDTMGAAKTQIEAWIAQQSGGTVSKADVEPVVEEEPPPFYNNEKENSNDYHDDSNSDQ